MSSQSLSFSAAVSPSLRRPLRFAVRAGSACQSPPLAADQVSFRRAPASLYEVLRVEHTASPTEIKAAYRTLAKTHHPDAAAESDGRDFIEIHNAYATLSDPAARAIYDLSVGYAAARTRQRTASYGVGSGYHTTRRWETDQCW